MDRPARVALIERLDRDGTALQVLDVRAWPLTLGRALDNDLVVDDPHVAAQHARIELDEAGRPLLRLLDTVNGARLAGRALAAGDHLPLPAGGATLQLGQTTLRLRLPGEMLAPEKPLPRAATTLAPTLAGVLLLALVGAEHFVSLDPGAPLTAWMPVLAALLLGGGLWVGFWALLSKLFRRQFDFGGHLRVAVWGLLALQLADGLLRHGGAALGSPLLWRLTPAVLSLGAAALLGAHLLRVMPQRRRTAVALAAGALAGHALLTLPAIDRQTDRWSRPPYMSTLPLPALRLHAAQPLPALLDRLGPLAERAAARAERAREEDRRLGVEDVD